MTDVQQRFVDVIEALEIPERDLTDSIVDQLEAEFGADLAPVTALPVQGDHSPIPLPRSSERRPRKLAFLAAVASFALILGAGVFARAATESTANVQSAEASSGSTTELVVFLGELERPRLDVIKEIEKLSPSPERVIVEPSVSDEQFDDYWAEYKTKPERLDVVAYRVEVSGNGTTGGTQLSEVPGVVRVEPFPGCNSGDAIHRCLRPTDFNPIRAQGQLPLAFLLVLSLLVGTVLVRQKLLPWRAFISLAVIVFAAFITYNVVQPVHAEIEQAKPAMEIVEQQYTGGASSDVWHVINRLDSSGTNTGDRIHAEHISGVDRELAKYVADVANPIYVWYVWVFPVLFLTAIMVLLSVVAAPGERWKLISLAVVFVLIAALILTVPFDLVAANQLDSVST